LITAVVTGGAGFVGSHLCEALLDRGDKVVIVDSFEDFYAASIKRANIASALQRGARLVELDIREGRLLARVLAAESPDVVVHLAARAGVRPSLENPQLYVSINVEGTLSLLEACRQAGAGRLVFGSSSSVYGTNSRVPFQEDDPVQTPASPYGATKAAGELLCHTYAHLHGLQVACLRFFTVYGPRQRPDMAIHKFARLLAERRPVPLFGEGTARDYTYVSDIVQGVLGAIDRPRPFAVYNLGDSKVVELGRMVALLAEALGVEAEVERLPRQPGDVPTTFADISRARRDLDYSPGVPFERGIRLFADWFLSSRGAAHVPG